MSVIQPASFFSTRRSGNSTSENGSANRSSSSASRDETPLRRRDAVTVSTSELNKLFDAFNSIAMQLRDHRKILKEVETSQDAIVAEVRQLREDNKVLQEKLEEFVDQGCNEDESRIPPEISNKVHLLHNALEERDRYKPEESILSPHNTSVRQGLHEQLEETENGYPFRFVKRAIVRYYETKRKLFLQSLPENQVKTDQIKAGNKLRSRRKRLYTARSKVAEGEDRDKLNALSYEYVSDEENGVGDNRGKWVVRPPMWRSDDANALMRRLQDKVEESQEERPRSTRVLGTPPERSKPRLLVTWAIRDSIHAPQRRASPSPVREQSPLSSRSLSPMSPDTNKDKYSSRTRSPSPIQRLSRKRGRSPQARRVTRSQSMSPAKKPGAGRGSKFQKWR